MKNPKVGRAIALIGLAATVAIVVGTAQAGPATKNYHLNIDPAAATATYTLTLTNAGASTHSLGAANVTVPSGFTVQSVGAAEPSAGRSWSAALSADASVIELRAVTQADALAPGEQVSSVLTLQTPCTSGTWQSRAKQSNDFNGPPGNDFDLTGDAPVVTAAAGAATALEFVAQPSMTQVDTAISPAVTVGAVDACGNPADGDVAIGIDTNPSGGTLTGTLSQPLDALGVATFSDLEIDTSGTGYVLSATSAGMSALSSPFNVVDYLCRSTLICEASDDFGTTTVSTPGPPSGGAMGLSFGGFGAGFSCTGAPSFQSIGSLATIDPFSYIQPIQVTTRWAKSVAPGTGVANFILCWSETGLGYEVAAPCTKQGKLPAGSKLCELKRNRNGVGDLLITFLIHPTDPYAGLGS
jgi:hypothetical protein